MTNKWNSNELTFQQGLKRIVEENKKAGFDYSRQITTSQDKEAKSAVDGLKFPYVPDGFTKFQLPFALNSPTQMFISVGAPGTKVPEHSHDEGDGVRFIVNGSIKYNGKELKTGDWMYVPKGKKYSFEVGPLGATFFYCYECCC